MTYKRNNKHLYKSFIIILILVICSYNLSCMKQVTTQKVTGDSKPPVHIETEGDTTSYTIGFHDKKELKTFTRKFKKLLYNYTLDTVVSDTINNYFCLRITPEPKTVIIDSIEKVVPIEKAEFIVTDILTREPEKTDTVTQETDTIIPIKGGNVVIYSERKFLDNPFSGLAQVIPFSIDTPVSSEDAMSSHLLITRQISPTKIKITCTDKLINSSGKQLTAFNVVQAWTYYIKNNPAEGIALFKYVKGIKKFIKGEEAIIQGFSVTNQKNIMILLDKPDSYALHRLYSTRLLPITLNLGQLYLKNEINNKITLSQNRHYQGNKSFIDQCTIICGDDKKPIISYSLNKYDMIILSTKKDIEYANRSLIKNSNIIPFFTDRYFISLAPKSTELRKCLKKVIIPLEIQKNAVKAEGELISAIESSDQKPTPEKIDPNIKKPSDIESIRILYNSDDPISKSIAEKIFSDLSNSGISGKLMGLTVHKVQNALIDRTYDIAVGWVSDRILTDDSEKLRLAAIWFNGESNEAKRISENREIPLFTIKKYALCKKHIKFYKNRLTGIFRQE